MFVLQHVRDSMRVRPELFDADKDAYTVLQILADDKYANRVVPNVGLCVGVFDFIHIGDSHIFPGDGAAHTEVELRMIVFRPSKGQILEGVVHKCTREGIHVSVGFFADVWVPAYKLHQPSVFDPKVKEWEWKYDQVESEEDSSGDANMEGGEQGEEEEEEGDGQAAASNPFFYTVGDKIRVRVTEIEYTTLSRDATTGTTTATTTSEAAAAAAKGEAGGGVAGGAGGGGVEAGDGAGRRRANSLDTMPPVMLGRQRSKSVEVKVNQEPPPAMRVVASVDEDGLGMVAWWPDADEDEEADEEEEEEE